MKATRTIVSCMANAFAVAGLSLLLILAVFTLLDGMLRAFANTPIDLVREIGDMVAAICGTCCLLSCCGSSIESCRHPVFA